MGKCNNDQNLQSLTLYPLFNPIKCPLMQRSHTFHTLTLNQLLKANNAYEKVTNLFDLYDLTADEESTWGLNSETAFQRNTIQCIMKNYKVIGSYFPKINPSITGFDREKERYKNVLSIFLDLTEIFFFIKVMQILLLATNVFQVFLGLLFILIKIGGYCCHGCCKNTKKHKQCLINEFYFTYCLDICVAFVGGYAFFTLHNFNLLMGLIFDTQCLDDNIKYVFGIYSQILGATADQNLQIFVIVLMKIALQVFSIIFSLCMIKCKINKKGCNRVCEESFAEQDDGGDEISEEELLKLDEEKAKTDRELGKFSCNFLEMRMMEGPKDGKNENKVNDKGSKEENEINVVGEQDEIEEIGDSNTHEMNNVEAIQIKSRGGEN